MLDCLPENKMTLNETTSSKSSNNNYSTQLSNIATAKAANSDLLENDMQIEYVTELVLSLIYVFIIMTSK